MSLTRLALVVLATLGAVALVATQVDTTRLSWWAAQTQRDIQNAMAGSVRAVRAGDAGALLALCGLTFSYGVVHAIGPGHGKVLIGGAALASRARLRRLSLLTLLSSLGQSLSAILLVLLGTGLITLTSDQLVGLSERALAPISYALIGLIGLWIAARGLRALWRQRAHHHTSAHSHDHAHHHGDDADGRCGCGHKHGPDLAEIGDAMSLREMAVLVLSIAMRPCTGAIFLLVICWRLDILSAGVLATLAMGLGTAAFNLIVAGTGRGMSRLAFRLNPAGSLTLIAPITQLFAGLLIALAAGVMLTPML